MRELGQHKGDKVIAEEPHAHYFGQQFQLTIRPARSPQKHDPYAPGGASSLLSGRDND